MKIKSLSTKTINTKFGEKDKYILTFEERPEMFDCFVGNWNRGWKVGADVNITEDQITSRDYEGKKYFSIVAPKQDDNKLLIWIQNHEQRILALEKALEKDIMSADVPFN